MSRLGLGDHLKLFLYGYPWMDPPDKQRSWTEDFSTADLRYFWDGPWLPLLSHCFGVPPAQAPRLFQKLDRTLVFPLWKTTAQRTMARQHRPHLLDRLWGQAPPSKTIDVFHHTAGLLFPLRGQANVVTIHDLIGYHFALDFPETHLQVGGSFDNANQMDAILTYTEHVKQDVIDSLKVPAAKIHVTPLAAHAQYRPIDDSEQRRSVLAKHDLASQPYVLYLGAIEERKNLYRLVEAFRRLKQEAPSLRHQLVLVGDGYPQVIEKVRRLADQLEVGRQVRILGFIPFADLPAVLAGAELFVFPSLLEGFGLPPLEAMACGTPVIVARASTLPEVVGDAAVLVDPYQVEEMATAMHRVLTDGNLQAAFREKGLARVKMFSWERTARLTRAAYQEAWERWHREGRGKGRQNHNTKYRAYLHDHVIQSLTQYTLTEETCVPPWPM
jgi:glycosyltransferase involved in cell wall biosynthesis